MNNEEDEEQINAIRGKKKNKIKGIMKNIRKKIYNKYIESFARYKDDKVLVRDIVISYFNESKDIVLIDKIGKIFVLRHTLRRGISVERRKICLKREKSLS